MPPWAAMAAVPPEDRALASAGSRPRPGGSRPLTAALCCGFCSPRLRAEFRGDLLMRQEVGLSLEAG